jgi:protein-disulfide isomerase
VIRFLSFAFGALVCGFLGAWLFALSGLAAPSTEAYLLEHPEILPKMAEKLQANETARRLSGVEGEIARPFPGAVLGNPHGTKTLVEFTDYGCTFCRQSIADVQALVAADPQLRVVVREWPIFEGSDAAARMALAAARQGKYAEFHDLMFAHGPPSPATIALAAKGAGLDMAAAQAFAASPAVELELRTNHELARKLGFDGTPSWVIGKQAFSGAVGRAQLADAIAAADGNDGA